MERIYCPRCHSNMTRPVGGVMKCEDCGNCYENYQEVCTMDEWERQNQ